MSNTPNDTYSQMDEKNAQELTLLLKQKMYELMDLYYDCKIHMFTVTDEVKALGHVLLREYRAREGRHILHSKGEQILFVARILKQVSEEHQRARGYR